MGRGFHQCRAARGKQKFALVGVLRKARVVALKDDAFTELHPDRFLEAAYLPPDGLLFLRRGCGEDARGGGTVAEQQRLGVHHELFGVVEAQTADLERDAMPLAQAMPPEKRELLSHDESFGWFEWNVALTRTY